MKQIGWWFKGAVGAATLLAAGSWSSRAAADVITVTSQNMDVGFGNGCTLPEAIVAANTGNDFFGCSIQDNGSSSLSMVVPEGDYFATAPLTITADVEVYAFGGAVLHTGSDYGIGISGDGDGDGPRVVIDGLEVQGADAPTTSIVGLLAESGATLLARNVTVTGCNGAGVLVDGASLEIDNSDLSENGVGLQVSNGSSAWLLANSFFANEGDGLSVHGSIVDASQSFFNGNGGNGVVVNGTGRVVVTDSSFGSNGENGAALINETGTDVPQGEEQLVAEGCLFQGNAVSGVYNDKGTAIISSSELVGNSESGLRNDGDGGNASTFCLDSTIRDNFAQYGGGIWNAAGPGSKVFIVRTAVIDNVAFEDGGGVFSLGQPFFSDSTFSGNFAFGDGGGMHITGNELTIFHSTLMNNQALGQGGGIYADPSQPRIFYSVIAGNTAPVAGQADVVGNQLNGFYSLIGEPFDPSDWSPFNDHEGTQFDVDPMLGPLQNVDSVAWAHPPLAGSPVIDVVPLADCETSTVLGGPELDQRGLGRPVGAGCDAGSIEFGEPGALPDIEMLNWTSSAPLALTSERRTQGTFGLSVGGGGYRIVNSGVVRGVTQLQSHLLLDVFVPANPPNPYWIGAVQMFATCPAQNLHNVYLGQNELTGLPLGAFSTLEYAIPSALYGALAQQDGCFFSVALNTNATAIAPVIDNLRTATR